MSQQFATGKYAIALCDRCGRQVMYRELRAQIVNMSTTGLLVCDDCLDQDHPQYQVGMWPIDDPQALRDPRPSPNDDRDTGTGHVLAESGDAVLAEDGTYLTSMLNGY